jgi:hypothetical protein
VQSGTGGGTLRDNNLEFEIYADGTLEHFQNNFLKFIEIGPSGILSAKASNIMISGEGGIVDTLGIIRFDGNFGLTDGTIVRLVNLNNYTITITHGTNIKTKSESNIFLTQDIGITFMMRSGVAYEV